MQKNMRRLVSYLTSLLVGVLALCNSAQSQVSSFKHFGLDMNVFPSRIECINQSQSGDLVIGTLAGLVLYDGYSFVQMTERAGLAENAVSALGVLDNQIWVGHWTGSISILNQDRIITEVYDIRKELNFSSIVRILPIAQDAALIVDREGGLFLFKAGTLEQLALPSAASNEAVVQLRKFEKRLFVITQNAIYETQDLVSYNDWNRVYQANGFRINDAIRLDESNWLMGTNSGAKYRNIADNQSVYPELESQTESYRIANMLIDFEENIWMGSIEQGIVKFHPLSMNIEFLKRDNGLSFNQVRAQFLDREGTVWIGTSAGLDQYLGQAFRLYERRFGLPDNLIWDFYKDGDALTIATPSGLFQMQMSEDGKIGVVQKVDLGSAEPRKIVKDPLREQFWIIDADGGLWKGNNLNFEQQKQIEIPVQCVADVNGEVWLGTDEGVLKLVNDQISEQYTAETGLGGNKVNGIYYSKVKNETWITALGGQATLFREGRFKKYGAELGLTSSVIQDAAFDGDGNPWFATYDDGVFYLENDTFINLSMKASLTSTTTFAIDIDSKGSVWIGHNWGLDLYRIPFDDITFYGSDQGFLGIEVNPGAIDHDDQGTVWMGTLMGLLEFKPTQYRTNVVDPITRIKSVRLGEQTISQNERFGSLNFSNTDLIVDFTGISLANPARNTYWYRLVGMHSEWKETHSLKNIEYLALPPGEYDFEIYSCNNSGTCNTQPTRFNFTITPPFYRTWWFYTLLFMLVVGFIYMLDSFRITSLINAKHRLEEQLALRDEQLLDIKHAGDEMSRNHQFNHRIAHSVFIDPARDQSWFGKLAYTQFRSGPLGTEHFFKLRVGQFMIGGLIDLSLTDMSGLLMLERIKNFFLAEVNSNGHIAAKDIVIDFTKSVSLAFESIEKHKGCNWILWIKSDSQRILHAHGMRLYFLEKGQVHEWISATTKGKPSKGEDLIEFDTKTRIIAVSDGLFETLNDDGTKTYSASRFLSVLKEYGNLDNAAIIEVVKNDLLTWTKSSSIYDDITIIGIENE